MFLLVFTNIIINVIGNLKVWKLQRKKVYFIITVHKNWSSGDFSKQFKQWKVKKLNNKTQEQWSHQRIILFWLRLFWWCIKNFNLIGNIVKYRTDIIMRKLKVRIEEKQIRQLNWIQLYTRQIISQNTGPLKTMANIIKHRGNK